MKYILDWILNSMIIIMNWSTLQKYYFSKCQWILFLLNFFLSSITDKVFSRHDWVTQVGVLLTKTGDPCLSQASGFYLQLFGGVCVVHFDSALFLFVQCLVAHVARVSWTVHSWSPLWFSLMFIYHGLWITST